MPGACNCRLSVVGLETQKLIPSFAELGGVDIGLYANVFASLLMQGDDSACAGFFLFKALQHRLPLTNNAEVFFFSRLFHQGFSSC